MSDRSAQPADARALLRAGRALAAEGRGDEADAAFEQAFALEPALRLTAEAIEARAEGRMQDALRLCGLALGLAPDAVDALLLSAGLQLDLMQPAQAERAARRATQCAPDSPRAWMTLGLALNELDRGAEAVTALRRAVALAPGDGDAATTLATVLATQGDSAGASVVFADVLAADPDHAPALMGLGHARKTLGDRDGAVRAYRDCLALTPDAGEVWWSLANLKTFRFSPADLEAMERLLASDQASALARASVAFALGKAAEDAGEHERAFACFAQANALQRQRVRYDPVQTEAVNDRIIEVFDSAFFSRRLGQGRPEADPIFIVGLPRSGSTLIEQILASHPDVDGTSELPTLGRLAGEIGRFRSDGVAYPEAIRDLEPADLDALGQAYLARTRHHRTGRPRFTDKMPNNFASIGLIHAILPNARIIDARRHPMDACMGAFKQMFARGQTFTYDLFELGEYYIQYDRLMGWWDKMLPGRVLRVHYEDVVLDQEAQTRRILDYCGLDWNAACLDFHRTRRAVNTASSEQVRQPLFRDALGAWRRYEAQLGDLYDQLRPVIEALPERIQAAAAQPNGQGARP